MPDRLRLALNQMHPHPGAIARNLASIRAARAAAAGQGADLLVTPQGSLSGHSLFDLARLPAFIAACAAAIEALAAETADGGPGVILGAPWATPEGLLHDTVFVLEGGRIAARRARHVLPRHGHRVFDPGPAPGPVAFRGRRLGLLTGEDWHDPEAAETLLESGAELLLALDAEPFAPGLLDRRIDRAVARVVESGLPLAVLGACGGQESLVCPGGSFVLNADRSLALRLPPFGAALVVTEWQGDGASWHCTPQPLPPPMPELEQLWRAMAYGLRDFVTAGGHGVVVVPPDGTLGHAVTKACAVDALGTARVTSGIASGVSADGLPPLLLNCADKAAMALGPDTTGGFSVVQDLWHRQLLDLARWRNATNPAIPDILLRDATDPLTEALLEALIDREANPQALLETGFDRADLQRVWHSLHLAEYKRRQSPPGLQLGRHAFGRDRRYPITHGFMSPFL